MPKNKSPVAVFGGTGFIGNAIVTELTGRHIPVRLIIRNGYTPDRYNPYVTPIISTARHVEPLQHLISGCKTVVYSIGIIREFPSRGITFRHLHQILPQRILAAAHAAGVQRYILISANGVDQERTEYEKTKRVSEKSLESSGLNYTIVRPSLVFGYPERRTEFCTQMRQQLINPPLPVPMFFEGMNPAAGGDFQLSPVHVSDIAHVVGESIENGHFEKKIISLGGPETISWRELMSRLSKSIGKRKMFVPIPVWSIRWLIRILSRSNRFPITVDQLQMLVGGNTCTSDDIFKELNHIPTGLNSRSLQYLNRDSE